MALVMEGIKAVRNIRAELSVAPSRRIPCVALAADEARQHLLEAASPYFRKLAGLSELSIGLFGAPKPEKAMSAVVSGAELYLPLAGLIDLEQEIQRLQKELEHLEAEVRRGEKKLSNPGFVNKAPADVVEKERAKLDDWMQKRDRVAARIAELQG
jgi:valyl-tRNA synthetase